MRENASSRNRSIIKRQWNGAFSIRHNFYEYRMDLNVFLRCWCFCPFFCSIIIRRINNHFIDTFRMKWVMILSVSFMRPPFLVFLIVSPTKEKVAREAFWNSSIKTSADCLLSDSIVSLDTKININKIVDDDDWWMDFDVVGLSFNRFSEQG